MLCSHQWPGPRSLAATLSLMMVATPLATIPLEAAFSPAQAQSAASSGPSKPAGTPLAVMLERARQGDPQAEYRLAALGLAGKLGKQKPEAIIGLLGKASSKGHREATFLLGTLYLKGWHLQPDAARAATLFTASAEAGHVQSQNAIANLLYAGTGVPQDKAKAGVWFQKAADKGSDIAQANLGLMYLRGDGVAKDVDTGLRLLTKAADGGLKGAQYNLAAAYAAGEGVTPDPARARDLFIRAAEAGDQRAQYALGRHLVSGKVFKADWTEGMKWLLIAAVGQDRALAGEVQATIRKLSPAVGNKVIIDGGERSRLWLMKRQWQVKTQEPSSSKQPS